MERDKFSQQSQAGHTIHKGHEEQGLLSQIPISSLISLPLHTHTHAHTLTLTHSCNLKGRPRPRWRLGFLADFKQSLWPCSRRCLTGASHAPARRAGLGVGNHHQTRAHQVWAPSLGSGVAWSAATAHGH